MKYTEKYPDIDLNTFFDDSSYLISSPSFLPCLICKEETPFVDISFQAPICSEECQQQLNDSYEQELNVGYDTT